MGHIQMLIRTKNSVFITFHFISFHISLSSHCNPSYINPTDNENKNTIMMMMAMMGNSNCLVHQDRFYVTNETKVNKMERNKESTLPPPHNNKTKLHLTHIEIENDQKKLRLNVANGEASRRRSLTWVKALSVSAIFCCCRFRMPVVLANSYIIK